MNKADLLYNLTTAIAYYVIAVCFLILVRKDKIGMVLGRLLFYLTATFILTCATHHLCLALGVQGWWMNWTDCCMAFVSILTAVYMVALVPHIVRYPTIVDELRIRSKKLDHIINKLEKDYDTK